MTSNWEGSAQPGKPMSLDPDNEFEAVIIDMVSTYWRKNSDYANPSERYSNFRESGEHVGVSPWLANEMLVATKQSRIKNLIQKIGFKQEPLNESLRDSLLDRAVYSVIALVLYDMQAADHDQA